MAMFMIPAWSFLPQAAEEITDLKIVRIEGLGRPALGKELVSSAFHRVKG